MIGKSTGTVGNTAIRLRGISGKKYTFARQKGEGYMYVPKETSEIADIFATQHQRYSYYFTPVLDEGETISTSVQIGGLEDKSLDELKDLCKECGIAILPVDKNRSLTRMLEAYKKGSGQ